MSDHLPSDVTQTIAALLASGKYVSQDEILRDALAALRQRDEDVAAIRAGIADMEAGRCRPFAECDDAFRARHNIAKDA
jgi:Arc/MetJ-type ribon-helix-helix transcriptional regulator